MAEDLKKKSKRADDPPNTGDERLDDVLLGIDPGMFLAKVIVETESLSLASKRRICKERASSARLHQEMARVQRDRQAARSWGSIAWALSKLR